ncbi:MAG: type II secretion system F family protein [Halodesulfurarchaeum sp.]
MRAVLAFLPLLVLGVLLGLLSLAVVSRRIDRIVTRVALHFFGPYVADRRSINTHQVDLLAGAHRSETYRAYAAKTFTYASIAAIAGSVGGVYAFLGSRSLLLAVAPDDLPWLLSFLRTPPAEMGLLGLFGLLLASSATAGVLAGFGTYRLRWYLPQYEADERARRIDSTLKRNVAFLFALSRSGMPFAQVLRTLASHTAVYGETAREFRVTVKDVDLLGADIVSGIERTSDRTPSDELEEFTGNLASVFRSGGSLSEFLRDQYEYFLEEESSQQDRFIELLGTLAEAYVTVFVAGMLFLITILVVVGLLLGGTLSLLRVLVYVVLGLANLGFIVYLDTITEDLTDTDEESAGSTAETAFRDVPAADVEQVERESPERTRKNRYRLAVARRIGSIRTQLRHPRRLLTDRPTVILWVTAPLGLLWLVAGWWPILSTGSLDPAALDGPLIQSALFVTGSFAVTYEVGHRRIKRIEAAIPDFLERLAATNEAGMSMVESFGRVAHSDLGALSTEVRRTWTDVQIGAHMEGAFRRFQDRIQTPAITRVVTLATNAMGATNDIGPVLRIAADEAKSARRLERDRYNELVTYVVVVYVAFFVFLGIVLVLDQVFIPSIPTGLAVSGGARGVGFAGNLSELTAATKDAYSLLFFHASLVQGYVSGFVAGQMSDGQIAAGAKHATVMLALAYGVFFLLG